MANFPLYTTTGDWAGMLIDGYLYNRIGDWVGFVDRTGQVYSAVGEYVGWLARDFRILRKREADLTIPRHALPARPPLKVRLPASAALPALMSELGYDTLDVFDECPERLHSLDADPAARDMD